MLLGMGIVFGFLTLLVIMLRGMSALAARLYTPPPAAPDIQPAIEVVDDSRLIAVITAAVARYRASRSA
jgi:oxaloacetate decarboxylase gamma subunit